MTDTRDLVKRAAREIEASRTTSTTPRGQSNAADQPEQALIETINQVFALFRLNYHNQYYAAFPDAEQLKQIKKLWLESLADYPVAQILQGARHAIEHSDYLPTLNRMHESCREALDSMGLPAARQAYMEACLAQTPQSAQRWSHPAVYLAGRDAGWFLLANNPEQTSWPVFRDHYERYCSRVMRGEVLDIPAPASLEKPDEKPLPPEEQLARLRQLREELGL